MSIRDRLQTLLDDYRHHMPKLLKNAADPIIDQDGTATVRVASALRFIGAAEYILNGDVRSFRRHLIESSTLQLQLFLRAEKGEPINESRTYSILRYKSILDALAACDVSLAVALAERTGLHDSAARTSHPFDVAFGYALKAMVLNIQDEIPKRLEALEMMCRKLKNVDFAGYVSLYRGIVDGDLAMAQEGIVSIEKGHRKQAKRRGVFNGSEDEILSVWGVGVANLARWRGLPVTGIDPFIPRNLLLDESTTSTN